jgi:hypothetical protein
MAEREAAAKRPADDAPEHEHHVGHVEHRGLDLLPQHRAKLAASGVADEVVRDRGYRSIAERMALEELGFMPGVSPLPGLLIPLRWVSGDVVGCQYRPDAPELSNGKAAKYVCPSGQKPVLDVPVAVSHQLGDLSTALFITEGALKADAAASKDLCCIALSGVWMFAGRGGVELAQWGDVALGRRAIFIVFDSDQATNPKVALARDRLAACLADKGARAVRYVNLPAGDDEKVGLDDWLAAGGAPDELASMSEPCPVIDGVRSVRFTAARDIDMRPVRWLWSERLPLGAISLLGGREGIGKSTCAYTIAAQITRGTLSGAFAGHPRVVLVASTEDSWGQTIVPRLHAAEADLGKVLKVDVVTSEGVDAELVLPTDIPGLRDQALEVGAVMLLLDPLLSRLSATLDSHKDAEVRRALEPLGTLAESADMSVLGLIHVNKSGSADPLSVLMASRAFPAFARSVLFAMKDPDDETHYLLGQPKNNLGRNDLPTLRYSIEGRVVGATAEGVIETARLVWEGETERDIFDALEAAGRGEDRSAVEEAADWLEEFMQSQSGYALSKSIKSASKNDGHNLRTLQRARVRLNLRAESVGFPRRTYWLLPDVELPEEIADDEE